MVSTTSELQEPSADKENLAMRKGKKVLIMVLMTGLIGGFFTGLMTYVNIGLSQDFLGNWGRSFAMAMLVMAPIGGLLMVFIDKAVKALFSRLSMKKQNLIFGLCMALCMQTILASITAFNTVGLAQWDSFFIAIGSALLAALPLAFVMAVVMGTIIKPILDKNLSR